MALTTKTAGALVHGEPHHTDNATIRVRFPRHRVAAGDRRVKGDVADVKAADAEVLLRMGIVET